jgi:hypothetical protein
MVKLEKALSNVVFPAILALIGLRVWNGFENVRLKNARYDSTVKAIENLDNSPGTTDNDWRIAYRDVLGKNFDHSLDNTRYLSMNQLQRIIDYANSRSSSR